MSILLYNSDKKELIGVFSTPSLASRYLYPFGKTAQRIGNSVLQALKQNSGIRNTDLGCRIVVRRNSDKDNLLNDEGYFVTDGYRGFIGKSNLSFDDTKETLQIKANEALSRRWAEYKSKKENL